MCSISFYVVVFRVFAAVHCSGVIPRFSAWAEPSSPFFSVPLTQELVRPGPRSLQQLVLAVAMVTAGFFRAGEVGHNTRAQNGEALSQQKSPLLRFKVFVVVR